MLSSAEIVWFNVHHRRGGRRFLPPLVWHLVSGFPSAGIKDTLFRMTGHSQPAKICKMETSKDCPPPVTQLCKNRRIEACDADDDNVKGEGGKGGRREGSGD